MEGWALFFILLCVLSEGFFSGSEIAIVSLPKVELKKRLQKGDKAAKLLNKLLSEPEKLLTTTLIGTNLSTVTGSTIYATLILGDIIKVFPQLSAYPELVTVLTFTPITLTFGELIPKSLFQKYSHQIAFKIVYPIYLFYYLFKPISFVVMTFAKTFAKLVGAESEQNPFVTKEELQLLVESSSRFPVEKTERNILKNILKLREKTVGDIYVPLLNVVAVNENAPVKSALSLLEKSGFSKLPVYRKRFDDIVGYISIGDLLNTESGEIPVKELMKPILVFPEYMSIFDALKEFRKSGDQMAIVVDEYGSTLGILTLEDILEEIVGRIEDEFDKSKLSITKKGNEILADGSVEIEELNKLLKKPLPKSPDYVTVAGLILSKLGRFPKKREKIDLETAEIIVEDVEKKRIKKVKVKEK
ncbi:hemolysin family protein [Desulfurobacterium thermolithotrophum]|uniref:hemolysin family protein n=1 Tax=Desulfurobacterium thermolithotrophum TaxID=64160 RepID=UPI0013D03EC2|nr:hemolysin family protein [Desulfurobacterium thermolithotrophum]